MREFLAREKVEHELRDVRKAPIGAVEAVALVRRHRRALAKKGARIVELDPQAASDDEVRRLFLGREGTLRAPTLSDGETVFAGFDEASIRALARR